MRDTNSGRRLPLKSKLLAGVTGLAAATMATAAYADGTSSAPSAPPADPQKWSPYAEIGGGVGSGFTAGKLDFFAPVWQDLGSMLYARGGIQLRGQDDRLWNFGLGYRTKVNSDWILGFYAGYDTSDTVNGHTVHQLSGGIEAMSADWDVRFNAYVSPKRLQDNANAFELYIHNTTIAILEGQDVSYSGFDGEVGYRVWNDESTDFRVFAGGYSFTHGDINNPATGINFNVRDIQGYKARAEVNMFDLDEIGPQSRLSFEAEVQHDTARGTGGFVGVELRIPLGDTGSGAQALDELDRRMADPQRRQENVLTTSGFTKPEPVIIYNGHITSHATNTLYYAQQQAAPGVGSYAHPTTIQDATARGPVNQFVVVTDKGGPVNATGTTIQSGETVVGGGQTFQVRGVDSHKVFTHTFAPGSGTPTLTAASAADNVLTLDSNSIIQGVNIAGPFNDAIYGHNINNVVISDVAIDGTAGGTNGIHIVQDVSGASTITIKYSSVSNVSNDGIYVQNTLSDGGASVQHLNIYSTTITDPGNDGVYVNSNVTGGSTATLDTTLTSSTVTGAGNVGVLMSATVGVGSSATQNITIDPTTITGGIYGFQVNGTADGGSLTQNVYVSDTNFSGQTIAGVAIFAYGENGGTVNQTINLDTVNVTGSYFPIGIIANAATGGNVTQNFALTNVHVYGGTYDGIDIVAHADGAGSVVHQNGTLNHVIASNTVYGDGVYAYAESTYGGTTIAHLAINDLTASGNYNEGLYVGVAASSSTADASTAAQYVTVTNSNLAGNFIGFEADASGIGNASSLQNVYVGNTVLSDTAPTHAGAQFVGGSLDAFGFDGGSVQQTAYFIGDTASGNAASGLAISANSLYTGFVEQTVQVYGTPAVNADFTHNGGYGVIVSANASNGGDIEQNIGVYYVDASHNGLGGLGVNTNSYGIAVGASLYYSHVSQNIIAVGDHFDHTGGNGVSVINYATYGAGIDQFVYVGRSTMDHNAGDGLHVESHDVGASYYGYAPGTHLYSDVYAFNSSASHNGGNGISIESDVTMPKDPTKVFGDSYLIQHVVISGVTADHNGNDGFIDTASATGIYSLNLQYITMQNGSTFDNNHNNGAEFNATGYFGPYSFGAVLQQVTVTGGSFSGNANDGIHATADASGFQGRAEQYFSIFDATVDHNHHDGMSFYNHSHDGAYYPGYTCNYVQGVTGGCGIVRQTVQLGYDDISHNGANGIEVSNRLNNYGSVYAKGGRPNYTASLFIEDSTINNNHGDGIHLYNYVAGNSYAYQYVVSLDNNINHNGGVGIGGLNNVTGNSTLVQKLVVYGIGTGPGSQIDDNHDGGIAISSNATAGGKIGNLVIVGYSDISGNGGDGIEVSASADSGAGTAATGVQQYVDIIGSTITGNHGNGVEVRGRATGAYAVTYQYAGTKYSTISGNRGDGVHSFEIAYTAAAADQNLYFAGDTISHNGGDGVYAVSISVDQSFTEQNVLFGYKTGSLTNIDNNHGDGIYVGTAAFSGSDAEQNVFVYDVSAQHNRGNGLGIGAGSNGYGFGSSYIYYSHVGQVVVAYNDTFDHNGNNGVSVSDVLYYGGSMNQTIEAIDVDMSHNAGAGFYSTTHLTSIRGNSFSFSTNTSTTNYLIGDTLDHNGANGIDIRSYANGAVYAPAFFGGYNYMQAHWTIQGVSANGNGGSGLSVNTQTSGRYTLNAEYLTVSGSTFDKNHGDGASFTSGDYYGPGGFGVSLQQVTISGSDFSGNGGDGMQLSANSSGRQGRAEQHFTVSGSTFDHNGADGVNIYASAKNGTYIATHACDTVQGLAGGCAFVRQSVVIQGSDISHNGNDGVNLITYANNYGAIYGASGRPHSPTLELYGTTVNDNNNRGLNVSNHVSGNSYLYQYVAAIDSSFNGNHGDGIYSASYVGGGSTMLQRALLYSYHTGASAHGNGGNGFKATIEALGGSYARDVNIVEGVNLNNNGSFGFDGAVAYADGASTGLQINAIYFNSINHNGDGVGLYSIGGGAQQISYIGGNAIIGNAFVGVYGEANFGAFQYIGVYTFGNNVHSNGTDYLFNAFGGSTQTLN